ncbi:MAG: hypothetical protein EU529_13760, partial [Promethearchaeota archaeon]
MITLKKKPFLLLFFIICMNIFIFVVSSNENPLANQEANDLKSLKTSGIESGGKLYTQETVQIQDCYINNKHPGLNRLPNIFIKNNFLSEAQITFDDIIVHNVTYELESGYTAAFKSRSYYEPTYVYQKFWIDKSQFLYNVSIYILDEINELRVDETNAWEVAIMNCSNDGAPFENGTIKAPLSKNRPGDRFQQWFTFDFLNSPIGPIYLDKDNTNWTEEEGVRKYWFAYRVKMPPDDSHLGGGEKYLFFKPDGEDSDDIDVGATFVKGAFYGGAHRKLFFENNVTDIVNVINNSSIVGDLDSFKFTDNDRFVVQSETDNLTITTRVNFGFWSRAILNQTINYFPNQPWEELWGITWEELWDLFHPYLLYGFDFNIVTNISDVSILKTAEIFLYNASSSDW